MKGHGLRRSGVGMHNNKRDSFEGSMLRVCLYTRYILDGTLRPKTAWLNHGRIV
jgi:hypothetical protein